MTTSTIEVLHLSGTIGAEIRGVDLRALSADQVADIRRVWLDRKVVFFPAQHLDPESHLRFAAAFGASTEGHPVIPAMPEHPHIHEIDYAKPAAGRQGPAPVDRSLAWHTDVTFMPNPPLGTILRAVTVPAAGGDTMWSDQQAAYDALSDTMQAFLGTLHAVHDGAAAFNQTLRESGPGSWDGEVVDELRPVEHPVVITHPETGRKGLYVNPMFTSHIAELSRAESAALLGFLYRHATRPEFTVRYHWHAGDVGFWDNRSTMHSVVGDFGAQDRVIQRVTLRGEAPR